MGGVDFFALDRDRGARCSEAEEAPEAEAKGQPPQPVPPLREPPAFEAGHGLEAGGGPSPPDALALSAVPLAADPAMTGPEPPLGNAGLRVADGVAEPLHSDTVETGPVPDHSQASPEDALTAAIGDFLRYGPSPRRWHGVVSAAEDVTDLCRVEKAEALVRAIQRRPVQVRRHILQDLAQLERAQRSAFVVQVRIGLSRMVTPPPPPTVEQ